MKCWNYRKGIPQVPVRLVGKTTIKERGLVDSGATYCVVHPRIASAMGLIFTGKKQVYGLGRKDPMLANVAEIELEISDFREKTEIVCIEEKYYPAKAPEVIIGRNFMNKYVVILDGEKVCIEDKRTKEK